VKTLSVRQPWAWALIHGGKDVENRDRAPMGTASLIGHRIQIHAAKGMTQHEYESAREYMLKLGVNCPRPDMLLRGGVIGTMRLTDVVSERPSRWFFGPRGLVVSDPLPMSPEDGPCAGPGQLGWFSFKAAGVFDLPKPWMTHWPERAPRSGAKPKPQEPEALSLFVAAAPDALRAEGE